MKIDPNKIFKTAFNDPTTWSLLFTNLVVIFFAIIQKWNIFELMLIYWIQSVIIGIFNILRLMAIRNYTTQGLSAIKGFKDTETPSLWLNLRIAGFFFLHYGTFHLVYFMFLVGFIHSKHVALDPKLLSLNAAMFFANHLYSFLYYLKQDQQQTNIAKIFFFPYARIFPMHLTFVLGAVLIMNTQLSVYALLLFLSLKTAADLGMHIYQHLAS